MGDEKIVPGTEVVFEPATAQADGNEPPQPKQRDESPEEVISAVICHGKSQEFYCNKRYPHDKIDFDSLFGLEDYLRFTPKMQLTALPIPKEHLIGLMKREHPEVKELFEQSDFSEALPETYDLHTPLPALVETMGYQRTLLASTALKKVERFTNSHLVLCSGYPLSLFIEDGENYRKFLRHTRQQTDISFYLFVDYGKLWGLSGKLFGKTELPVISPSSLESFVSATGNKKVQEFLTDLVELDTELRGAVEDKRFNGVIKVLYSRLKKYHPELTI